MSRTYRHRHLPRRTANYSFKHIIDGNCPDWRELRKEFEAQYGPKPEQREELIKHGTHREWVLKPRPAYWDTAQIFWNAQEHRWNYVKRPVWGSQWDHKELVDLPGSWRPTQEYFEYRRAQEIFDREYVHPVMSWHPYAKGHGCWCCYRPTRSNRRKNKVLAKYADLDTIFAD